MSSRLVSAIMASQIGNSAFTIAIFLVASIGLIVAASNDGQISSVRVVGSVFCDKCFRQEFSKTSYFIKGAPLAVECGIGKEGSNFRTEANTNEHGQFEVELPASIFQSETHLKTCSATLLQKESPCGVASMAKASSFSLKSKKGGIHTYSAGPFTYKPQTIPPSCSNEVANPNSMSNEIDVSRRSELESSKQVIPPIPEVPSLIPPIPDVPSLIPPAIPSLIPPAIPSLIPPLLPIPPIPFIPPVQHTLKSHPAHP